MASPWRMDRDRVGWWAIAIALGIGVAYLIYSFIGTFVFGVFIYYGTRPVYRRLERVIRPPSLAAGVALIALALPALLLLGYTILVGIQELNKLIQARGLNAEQFESLLGPYVDISQVVTDPQAFLSQPNIVDFIRTMVQEGTTYLGFFGNAALHLFIMILLAFYLLRDDHRLAAWWTRRFSDEQGVMLEYAKRVDRDFSNIFFGNLLNAVLTGIIGAISYGVLDFFSPAGIAIPYPALLGLITGVASLVPVVGIKLVYVPLAAFLGFQALGDPTLFWFVGVFVLVAFVVVDIIPDLVLRPYVSGRELHLGMVMLAYILGPLLFGWYGLFLGPMLLVLLVHFTALVLPELLAGAPLESEAVGASILTGATLSREPPDRSAQATLADSTEERGEADGQRDTDRGDGQASSNSGDGKTDSNGDGKTDSKGGDGKTDSDRGDG